MKYFLLLPLLAVITAAVLAGLGVAGADPQYVAGRSAPADRVDIAASVQRVDAAARELILRVLVIPRGRLGEEGGLAPSADLEILTSPSVRADLAYRAHARISTVDVPVALAGGSITEYPFDRYRTAVEFAAHQGGRSVPVRMTLSNRDALFHPDVDSRSVDGVAAFSMSVGRSRSVLVFAAFMMAVMWALAIAVMIGTRFLTSRRRGLVWPALGWMAATLFALTAFRNAAPGSPPIGSLIDYTAFLWAEATIAVCLITTVAVGARAEASGVDA